LKIKIEVDGETAELTGDQIAEEFTWHNMRDSNHCRRVRRKIFEALLALARSGSGIDETTALNNAKYATRSARLLREDIEQLRHACSVALGDLIALGMPQGVSTHKLLEAAIVAAMEYLAQAEAEETAEAQPCPKASVSHEAAMGKAACSQTEEAHSTTLEVQDRDIHAAIARHTDMVTALNDALRVISYRCAGNEDSEAAFDRVWRTLTKKIL